MERTVNSKSPIKTYVIDLFAGAGGTSTAIHQSNTNIEVIACINHDKNAILSHAANYPNCLHYTEDIRVVSLQELKNLVAKLRRENLGCKIAIWASLECTHFSKAKGGQSRDEDSRTLAEHLFRYDDIIQPDFFWIENVREFLTWGPIDADGKPIKQYKGCDYEKWVAEFKDRGYSYEYQLLNAADYSAYTSRLRYFGQFSKDASLIAFPNPTHAKTAGNGKKKWMPVRDVLDLKNEGVSILTRKKRLAVATCERIYSGLIKYVAKGDTAFVKKYFSGNPDGKVFSTQDPCGTITTIDHHALVSITSGVQEDGSFIKRYNGGNPDEKVKSLNSPIGTISTNGRHAIVKPIFLCSYYGNSTFVGDQDPCGTLTTKDRFSKVVVNFIDNQYGNGGASIKEPSKTAIDNRKYNYLMNPQFSSNGVSMDKPCFTLIARMDKAPPYVITAEADAEFALDLRLFLDEYEYDVLQRSLKGENILHEDKPIRVKIVEFMIVHQIADIKMRMLEILEMLRIQGFPKDYKLIGTQTEQKKYIGNSVEVNVGVALFQAIDEVIQQMAA